VFMFLYSRSFTISQKTYSENIKGKTHKNTSEKFLLNSSGSAKTVR
jgi:hypothetical protein